jgi:hypothetical protein
MFLPGSKSAVIALIAGSTTNGIKKRKAKTERIAVVPKRELNIYQYKQI